MNPEQYHVPTPTLETQPLEPNQAEEAHASGFLDHVRSAGRNTLNVINSTWEALKAKPAVVLAAGTVAVGGVFAAEQATPVQAESAPQAHVAKKHHRSTKNHSKYMVYGSHSTKWLQEHCDFELRAGGNGNGALVKSAHGLTLRLSVVEPKKEDEQARYRYSWKKKNNNLEICGISGDDYRGEPLMIKPAHITAKNGYYTTRQADDRKLAVMFHIFANYKK